MIRLLEPFRSIHYAGFYAAHALDAYRAESVEVALAAPARLTDLYPALLRGEAELVWGGPMRVLRDHAADPACPLVAIAEAVARDPFMLIGREPAPAFRFADLLRARLARFALVPTPWLCLQDDLRRAGVDPAALTLAPDMPVPDAVAALREGTIDVVQVFEPDASALLEDGFHLWHAAATRGPTCYTTFITTRAILGARGDELARVVRGLGRGLAWLAQAPAAEAVRILEPFFPALPGARLAAALGRYRAQGLWPAQPRVSLDGLVRLKSALISGGFIAADVPFAACVDNRFAYA